MPLFSERWSGPRYPLTRAMMLKEGLDVAPPFDKAVSSSMDFFAEEGKQAWEAFDNADVEFEHHAPDCKTFSRAGGKPFWIDGYRYSGPPPLRR